MAVSEVTDLLRAESIPDSLLTVLADMQHTACTSLCTCYVGLLYAFTENHIDAIALVVLPEDFEELQYLIPSSGLRMRIKTVIRN